MTRTDPLHLINMSTSPNNILDVSQHRDGVQRFMRYFSLRSQRPDLAYLQAIIEQYMHIPYENISKIIKLNQRFKDTHKIRLPEEIIEDHMQFHLGGTCFSLTYFLQTILTTNGFNCYPVMGDMRAGRNIHCCLVVILDNAKYLVDPGYVWSRPMEINMKKPRLYRTEFTGVELKYNEQAQAFDLFTFNRSERKWRYRFRDRPTPTLEFLQHWHDSFTKNSMHGICLTKITYNGLVYVHKQFMRETTFDGKRNINIKRSYHKTIQDIFGINKELVEQALAAIDTNMARERKLGLYVPEIKVAST
jgi:arylamine N-acetyltransferase